MAAETEGIALLSMYNDEEEDDEDEELTPAPAPPAVSPPPPELAIAAAEDGAAAPKDSASPPPPAGLPAPYATPPGRDSRSPLLSEDDSDYKTLTSPASPTPPRAAQPQTPADYSLTARSPTPPPLAPVPASAQEPPARIGSLTIVDYGHDDVAMSPDHEDGEIMSTSTGRVTLSTEIHVTDANLEDETPPGTVQILTPSTQQTPFQHSDLPEQPKPETAAAMDISGTDYEEARMEEANVVAVVDTQNGVDPLSNFLPPPVTTKCPEELQEKINKFLIYKRAGKSFNTDLRNRKDYRNPDFLQHAVRYQDIDQIGSCFSKDVFDPHGYDKSDYYDEIEADMKREMERKEQERKKNQKVDFVSGGTQQVTSALKITTQVTVAGISAATTSTLQAISTVDSLTRDVRQTKKTKWDKIDGDVKNPLNSGGHDGPSTVVHAAHLSAANAGAGYTAFAQQKRKEAEEKRLSERKFEKRS